MALRSANNVYLEYTNACRLKQLGSFSSAFQTKNKWIQPLQQHYNKAINYIHRVKMKGQSQQKIYEKATRKLGASASKYCAIG